MSVAPGYAGGGEYVVVVIQMGNMEGPLASSEVFRALEKVPGVDLVRVQKAGVMVRYDPIAVTARELGEILRKAGHPPLESKADRDSLMGEA